VAELGAGPYVVAINPRLPVKNLLELAEYARRNPGKLNASAGGNTSFMGMVLFQIVTRSKFEIISYKGTGPAATAIVAGEVDFASMDGSAFVSYSPGGKVKALAVAGLQRLSSLPDVPTTREAGLPDYLAGTAFGIYTKGGTPLPVVHRLNAEINKAIATPEVSKHLVSIGLDPSATTVEEYTQQYRKDMARWKDVVTRAKLPLQD
jgi:tripartite-type tricarboxylate transporter receptor subunit TctC